MKILIISIALLFSSAIVFSQKNHYTGKLIDKENGVPIDYAHFLDDMNRIICVTNEKGSYQFDKESAINNKIHIYKYGYVKKSCQLNEIKDTIFLDPKVFNLDEIVINNKKLKSIFYKFYFRTYDFKDGVQRRYIDGIVQFEHNKEKNSVKPKVLEYRSFGNDSILEAENKGMVRIQYEGTGIPLFKLMSILELVKKFKDYNITKEHYGYSILDESNTKIGSIYVNSDWSREKKATIIEKNELGKITKKLGASGKIIFRFEEEHYNPEDDFESLSYRKITKKTLFKRKKEKLFSTYETHSEIFLLNYDTATFATKKVKFKKDISNFMTKFWEEKNITNILNTSLYKNLKLFENKRKIR